MEIEIKTHPGPTLFRATFNGIISILKPTYMQGITVDNNRGDALVRDAWNYFPALLSPSSALLRIPFHWSLVPNRAYPFHLIPPPFQELDQNFFTPRKCLPLRLCRILSPLHQS
jgi:hypothetical protein